MEAAARFDAGCPGEGLMAALEDRGTHYVAQVLGNAVLNRLAVPAMDAAVWDALSNGAPAGAFHRLGSPDRDDRRLSPPRRTSG